MNNKPKEIIEFVEGIVGLLQEKRNEMKKGKDIPFGSLEHVEGQLYEAQYILENIWNITTK